MVNYGIDETQRYDVTNYVETVICSWFILQLKSLLIIYARGVF
jgi:hypothetical protein